MSPRSDILRAGNRLSLTAILSTALLIAAVLPAGAAGPPGNNGTVKIHSSTEGEPNPEVQNEPRVSCPFHVHFLFADTNQTGDWSITGQAPTPDADTMSDSYDTGDDTTVVTHDVFLSAGHYMLSWQGRSDQNVKHKTFWVIGDCGGGGGGAPGG